MSSESFKKSQIQMTGEFFKNFDQNSVWKWSCLFFDQNSSGKNNFWRIMQSFVLACREGDKFQGRRCNQNSSKIRWQWNSSRVLIRILVGNFMGKYIRWLKNSSRFSIRILVGNTAAVDHGIPLEFWLEFLLIINSAKSADCG